MLRLIKTDGNTSLWKLDMFMDYRIDEKLVYLEHSILKYQDQKQFENWLEDIYISLYY